MRNLTAKIENEHYRKLRQYQLDQAFMGRKLTISEVISELLEKGLLLESPTIKNLTQ